MSACVATVSRGRAAPRSVFFRLADSLGVEDTSQQADFERATVPPLTARISFRRHYKKRLSTVLFGVMFQLSSRDRLEQQ